MTAWRRGFPLSLLGISLVGLAIRVVYTVAVDPTVPDVGDATAYHLLAENLAAGRGYIRPFDLSLLHVTRATAEYPPLLPAVASLAARAGVHSVEGQRLWLCLFGAGTVAVVGLLGRRVAGATVGLIAAAIVAVHPMLFQADAILMPETLYALLVAVALLLAYDVLDAPRLWLAAALGATVGLAALARAEALLLVPLLTVPVALSRRHRARGDRLRLTAAVLLGTLAVVGPWTVRNAVRFHEFVPVSNNVGSAVDGANCDETYRGTLLGYWRYSPSCFDGFLQPELEAANEAEVANVHRRQGVDYARDHAGRLPVVAAARLGRTWGVFRPSQQITLATLEGRTRPWETIGTVVDLILLPFAFVGARALGRRRVPRWPLLVPVVLVCFTAMATYGNQRFRIAATPGLAVLAATGLVASYGWLRAHRPGP